MDSIFGIGAPELVVILLLAGIVMGPQRIRQVALWLGRTTAQLQKISRSFARQLNAELDAIEGGQDIKDTMDDIQELRRQLQDLRREVTSIAGEPARETEALIKEAQASLPKISNRIQPSAAETAAVNHDTAAANDAADRTAAADNGQPDLPQPIDIPDDPDA